MGLAFANVPFRSPICQRMSRAVMLIVLGCALFLASASNAAVPRNVLVLFSNGRLLPANIEIDRGISAVLDTNRRLRADVSVEFLDTPRFSGDAYGKTVASYLREKYSTRPPEVIIVGGEEALTFVLSNRANMFPKAPIVYLSVNTDFLKSIAPMQPDVIGIPVRYDFLGTALQALRWHPSARNIVVVTGTSDWDVDWEQRIRQEALELTDKVSLEFLTGLTDNALLKRLADLGSESVIFTPGYFRDGDGRLFTPREAALHIAASTNVPVYGPFPTFIGTGVVGGRMASYNTMGRLAATTTIDLLEGAAPAAISLPKALPTQLHIDWRQVRRWGIRPETIPVDAIVDFKAPTFWEAYWQYIFTACAVILIQTGLIAALLLERRRRRTAASALALSEQRMNLAAQAAKLTTWIWDLGRRESWVRRPSRGGQEEAGGPFMDLADVLAGIYPPDRAAVEQAARQAVVTGEVLEVEYRIQASEGDLRWMAARGRVDHPSGQRVMGVALDITPRKRAEAQAEQDRAALQHMARVSLLGQLSASIAHQLNQPLASILSNAEAAQGMLESGSVDVPELREICKDIVEEDHRAAEVIKRLGALFRRDEPRLMPLDLNDLVGDTLELLRTNLLTRQVGTTINLEGGLPSVDGDRVQLQQLLLNLIINAADAMISTPEAQRTLTVRTALMGQHVELCVADNGPGIETAVRDKVFNPFWTTKSQGMGIGLAICRTIAMVHHGSLDLADSGGRGATFRLLLPIGGRP